MENSAVSPSVALPVAVPSVRYAFHPLDTKLSTEAGMEIQTVKMNKDSGILSKRIKVPAISAGDVLDFCIKNSSSGLAIAVEEHVYSLQRIHVLKRMLLNGSESVSQEEVSLPYLSSALEGSGIIRITKELISSLFDSVLGNSLAALIAEAKGLIETCTEEEILLVAGPSLKLFRALFMNLAVKDSVLEPEQANKMKKIVAFAESTNGFAGMNISADVLVKAIDVRVSEAVEF